MSDPLLRVKASGFSGSGYYNPFTKERVIGVTTATGVLDMPGLRQYMVDQTVAYMAFRAQEFVDMEPEQIYNSGRWYHSRMKPTDFDDPYYDAKNAHAGVTDLAANRGTKLHDTFEAELNGWIGPDLYHDEEVQMYEQLLIWLAENDVEVFATEATVFGSTSQGFGYGGTCDLYARVNGVPMTVDLKTGRGTYDVHQSQLAALSAADTMAVEVSEGAEGAIPYTATYDGEKKTSYWVARELPPIAAQGILHLRPDDVDNRGVLKPAFCELKVSDPELIDAGWELFEASVAARHAQRKMKNIEKRLGREAESVF